MTTIFFAIEGTKGNKMVVLISHHPLLILGLHSVNNYNTTTSVKKGCHPNHGYNFVNSW